MKDAVLHLPGLATQCIPSWGNCASCTTLGSQTGKAVYLTFAVGLPKARQYLGFQAGKVVPPFHRLPSRQWHALEWQSWEGASPLSLMASASSFMAGFPRDCRQGNLSSPLSQLACDHSSTDWVICTSSYTAELLSPGPALWSQAGEVVTPLTWQTSPDRLCPGDPR